LLLPSHLYREKVCLYRENVCYFLPITVKILLLPSHLYRENVCYFLPIFDLKMFATSFPLPWKFLLLLHLQSAATNIFTVEFFAQRCEQLCYLLYRGIFARQQNIQESSCANVLITEPERLL
jgi:hypothetical protein